MGQSKEVDAEVNLPLITAHPAQKPFMMFVIGLAPRRQLSGWVICNLCAISKPEKIRGKSGVNPGQTRELSLFMQNEHWHFRSKRVKI